MFRSFHILALIPARAGSKGIKNKNIKLLSGKELIAYSIEAAKNSRYIDDIVVSTDGKNIADIAIRCGAEAPFLRPAELADDISKTIDVVLHAVNYLSKEGRLYDALVLLQPTQPLRTSEDIDLALEYFFKNDMQSIASVSEVESHPLLIRTITEKGKLESLLNKNSTCRRQDMPKFYCVNGAIYINKISELSNETSFNDNKIPFIMKREHSIDIDEPLDLAIAETIIDMDTQVNKKRP